MLDAELEEKFSIRPLMPVIENLRESGSVWTRRTPDSSNLPDEDGRFREKRGAGFVDDADRAQSFQSFQISAQFLTCCSISSSPAQRLTSSSTSSMTRAGIGRGQYGIA